MPEHNGSINASAMLVAAGLPQVHDILANRGSAGHPLSLKGDHQVQALQDLLTIHLLSITQRELQMGKEHQMQRLTGITACGALTSGALQRDPWVALVVLSLLTANVLHVLVQGEDGTTSAAAAPAAGATAAGATAGAAAALLQQAGSSLSGRGQAAASRQGSSINTGASSSNTSSSKKRKKSSNVIVKVDASKAGPKGAAAAPVRFVLPADTSGMPAGRKAANSEPSTGSKYQRVTSLRLLLQDGEWRVEVLSSRLVKPGQLKPGACVLEVGREQEGQRCEPLDNYMQCAMCAAGDRGEPYVHCRSCHFSAHSQHLPVGQRPKEGYAWWCKVCTKRGRNTRA
jgi:hypothetical protein